MFKPCTLNPSRKMIPAPRKPMPDTTCAATRVWLGSLGKSCENMTNPAAPKATSALVRNPAIRWRTCRSDPINAPQDKATIRFKVASCRAMVIGTLRLGPASRTTDRGKCEAFVTDG